MHKAVWTPQQLVPSKCLLIYQLLIKHHALQVWKLIQESWGTLGPWGHSYLVSPYRWGDWSFCQATALPPFCTLPSLCCCQIFTSAHYQVWFPENTALRRWWNMPNRSWVWQAQAGVPWGCPSCSGQPACLAYTAPVSQPVFPLMCKRCNLFLSLVQIHSHFRALCWTCEGFPLLWLPAQVAFSVSWAHQKSPAFLNSFAMRSRWVGG